MNWYHIHWHKPAVMDGDYVGYECRCGHRDCDRRNLSRSNIPPDLSYWVTQGLGPPPPDYTLPRPPKAPRPDPPQIEVIQQTNPSVQQPPQKPSQIKMVDLIRTERYRQAEAVAAIRRATNMRNTPLPPLNPLLPEWKDGAPPSPIGLVTD